MCGLRVRTGASEHFVPTLRPTHSRLHLVAPLSRIAHPVDPCTIISEKSPHKPRSALFLRFCANYINDTASTSIETFTPVGQRNSRTASRNTLVMAFVVGALRMIWCRNWPLAFSRGAGALFFQENATRRFRIKDWPEHGMKHEIHTPQAHERHSADP